MGAGCSETKAGAFLAPPLLDLFCFPHPPSSSPSSSHPPSHSPGFRSSLLRYVLCMYYVYICTQYTYTIDPSWFGGSTCQVEALCHSIAVLASWWHRESIVNHHGQREKMTEKILWSTRTIPSNYSKRTHFSDFWDVLLCTSALTHRFFLCQVSLASRG